MFGSKRPYGAEILALRRRIMVRSGSGARREGSVHHCGPGSARRSAPPTPAPGTAPAMALVHPETVLRRRRDLIRRRHAAMSRPSGPSGTDHALHPHPGAAPGPREPFMGVPNNPRRTARSAASRSPPRPCGRSSGRPAQTRRPSPHPRPGRRSCAPRRSVHLLVEAARAGGALVLSIIGPFSRKLTAGCSEKVHPKRMAVSRRRGHDRAAEVRDHGRRAECGEHDECSGSGSGARPPSRTKSGTSQMPSPRCWSPIHDLERHTNQDQTVETGAYQHDRSSLDIFETADHRRT